MADRPVELLQGTVDVLLLKTLSWGPMHGYGASRWLKGRSGGMLAVDDATLYQALHRLERKRLITAEWGVSENNRRARYYELTADGRKQLRREAEALRRYADALFVVLDTRTAAG